MNFYFEAAKVLDQLSTKQGSIKGILSGLPDKDRKRTSALVINTLKFKPVLLDVIRIAKLMEEEKKKLTSLNLALVLVHDLLLSRGIQAGDGPIKQAVLRHKTRLGGEFKKIKIKKGARSNDELAFLGDERAALIPRYVRVNASLWTVEAAIEAYTARGFVLSGPFESSKGFAQDEHIPNLLLFNPSTQFQEDPAYKSGKVILQDKASCFPAVVMNPPSQNGEVIDATAAPGNKTSHLSALMGNTGKLYALERDRKRFNTLAMMLERAGCKNTYPVHMDFLTVEPTDAQYAAVTHILLDPSCSGSGIVNRLDHLLETESENDESSTEQEDRLNKLSQFQLMMIRHAMRFPSVQKIVYSTCSIHATENEHVVKQALATDECVAGAFTLALPEDVLPTWKRRGIPEEMEDPQHAQSLIRCSPGEDATNGFFVSCFVRKHGIKRKAEDEDEEAGEDDEETKVAPKKKQKKKKKRKKTKSTGEAAS